nr:hypothetical protein Iba_chr11eCG6030 [Ipomoea batatas]
MFPWRTLPNVSTSDLNTSLDSLSRLASQSFLTATSCPVFSWTLKTRPDPPVAMTFSSLREASKSDSLSLTGWNAVLLHERPFLFLLADDFLVLIKSQRSETTRINAQDAKIATRTSKMLNSEFRPKFSGSVPDKLLLKSLKSLRFGFRDKLTGISPSKLLSLRCSDSMCKLARLSGILPRLKFRQTAKAGRNFSGEIVPTEDERGEGEGIRRDKISEVVIGEIESAEGGNPAKVRRKTAGEAEVREVNRDDGLSPNITGNGSPITRRAGSRIYPVIELTSGIGELTGFDSEQNGCIAIQGAYPWPCNQNHKKHQKLQLRKTHENKRNHVGLSLMEEMSVN